MKQNEKLLVYAVTGFLVVILMLAVVLGSGRDGIRQSDSKGDTAKALSIDELLDRKLVNPVSANEPAKPAGEVAPAPVATDAPLSAGPVVLQPPTTASLVTEKLGLNRKENGFRVVRIQAKDTFGTIVQKWCGKTDGYLEMAQGLNEDLDTTRMRVGTEVTLPWVEDEVILAAYEARNPKPVMPAAVPSGVPSAGPAAVSNAGMGASGDAAIAATKLAPIPSVLPTSGATTGLPTLPKPVVTPPAPSATGAVVPVAVPTAQAGGERKYTIKAGDSYWKIAEREVGKKNAKQFVDQIEALNPQVESDRLREGMKITLPPAAEKTAATH